jgi:hypothetical protein
MLIRGLNIILGTIVFFHIFVLAAQSQDDVELYVTVDFEKFPVVPTDLVLESNSGDLNGYVCCLSEVVRYSGELRRKVCGADLEEDDRELLLNASWGFELENITIIQIDSFPETDEEFVVLLGQALGIDVSEILAASGGEYTYLLTGERPKLAASLPFGPDDVADGVRWWVKIYRFLRALDRADNSDDALRVLHQALSKVDNYDDAVVLRRLIPARLAARLSRLPRGELVKIGMLFDHFDEVGDLAKLDKLDDAIGTVINAARRLEDGAGGWAPSLFRIAGFRSSSRRLVETIPLMKLDDVAVETSIMGMWNRILSPGNMYIDDLRHIRKVGAVGGGRINKGLRFYQVELAAEQGALATPEALALQKIIKENNLASAMVREINMLQAATRQPLSKARGLLEVSNKGCDRNFIDALLHLKEKGIKLPAKLLDNLTVNQTDHMGDYLTLRQFLERFEDPMKHASDLTKIVDDFPAVLKRLVKGETLIVGRGRVGESPLIVSNMFSSVSRQHISIRMLSDGKYVITDLKSTYGTFWKDAAGVWHKLKASSPIELVPGTEILIGAPADFTNVKLVLPQNKLFSVNYASSSSDMLLADASSSSDGPVIVYASSSYSSDGPEIVDSGSSASASSCYGDWC